MPHLSQSAAAASSFLPDAPNARRAARNAATGAVLQPLQPGVAACGLEPVGIDTNMRDVLTRLLQTDCDALPVAGRDGQLAGQVELDAVRQQLKRPAENPLPGRATPAESKTP